MEDEPRLSRPTTGVVPEKDAPHRALKLEILFFTRKKREKVIPFEKVTPLAKFIWLFAACLLASPVSSMIDQFDAWIIYKRI